MGGGGDYPVWYSGHSVGVGGLGSNPHIAVKIHSCVCGICETTLQIAHFP